MSLQFFSEKIISDKEEEPNMENNDNSLGNSSNLTKQYQDQMSNIITHKAITRKPNIVNANLQSYKHIKRKSKQKIEENMAENMIQIPPKPLRLKRNSKESLKQSKQSSQFNKGEDSAAIQSTYVTKAQHRDNSNDSRKFKKSAMTKEQINQMKKYVQKLQNDCEQVNSVSASENCFDNNRVGIDSKQLNKKSKTQYFHFQEFFNPKYYFDEQFREVNFQNLTSSEVLTIKSKCRNVIKNNWRLQKKMSWLKQQVEMHMQKQNIFQKQKSSLINKLSEKEKEFQQKEKNYRRQNERLLKIIENKGKEIVQLKKNKELQKLQELFIELHNKFSQDKQHLLQQIQDLKNDKQESFTDRYQIQERKISQLQHTIKELQNDRYDIQQNKNYNTQQNSPLLQSLKNEAKYLKIQNHILMKCKEENTTLKNRMKILQNQNARFKKLIIDNVKKGLKEKEEDYEDQQDEQKQFNESVLFTLSQISNQGSQ